MADRPINLRDRLAAGETGPEIDVAFHVAMHPDIIHRPLIPGDLSWCTWASIIGALPITTSLDACRAATPERWDIGSITKIVLNNRLLFQVRLVNGIDALVADGHAPTICGAWALAILQAAGKGGER